MIDNDNKRSSLTEHQDDKPKENFPHWGWEAYPFWFVVLMLIIAYGRVLLK